MYEHMLTSWCTFQKQLELMVMANQIKVCNHLKLVLKLV